jgi:hypothetical protein
VFWDPYSLLKVYRRFGGTYYLHLQGQTVGQAGNQQKESRSNLLIKDNYVGFEVLTAMAKISGL